MWQDPLAFKQHNRSACTDAVTHLHDAYIVALPHVSIILYEGDNSIGLCSSTFAGSLLVHKSLDTQVRHLS